MRYVWIGSRSEFSSANGEVVKLIFPCGGMIEAENREDARAEWWKQHFERDCRDRDLDPDSVKFLARTGDEFTIHGPHSLGWENLETWAVSRRPQMQRAT